jgi:Tol biopolymer transport system component
MMNKPTLLLALAPLAGLLALAGPAAKSGKSPDQDLPPHIRRLTFFGERADWSHDGKRLLFLSKTFGDVFEIDLGSGRLRLLTAHYPHLGYTRALYLANGDILLSGPAKFDPKDPRPSRVQCFLWVLDKGLTRPPVPLGTKCSEGPAVSRTRLHIAWTHVSAQYPDLLPRGVSQMHEADLVYVKGVPKLANRRLIVDSRDLPFRCTLETQNFRPPAEKELIFSAYGYQGTEVCGIDLKTKKVTNYSNAPGQYDEPEGIFPDGKHTCVECDRDNGAKKKGSQFIDIWKLALDGSGKMERLTYFNLYRGYKASNPVVSDDGKFMAFQMARVGDLAGVGRGIFLYDFARARRKSP